MIAYFHRYYRFYHNYRSGRRRCWHRLWYFTTFFYLFFIIHLIRYCFGHLLVRIFLLLFLFFSQLLLETSLLLPKLPLLSIQQCLIKEMIFLFINYIWLWKTWLIFEFGVSLECFLKFEIVLNIVLSELLQRHLKSFTHFYCNFLLLLEDELIALHVLLRVRFKICSELMQIETILVGAFLGWKEVLTELGSSEGSADQAVVVEELVDWQNAVCRISRVRESHVGWVRGASSSAIEWIVGVYHDLIDFTVLAKVVEAS